MMMKRYTAFTLAMPVAVIASVRSSDARADVQFNCIIVFNFVSAFSA
jgi:hypothetical protein